MTPYKELIQNIRRYVEFSDADAEKLIQISTVKAFRKRQFLDQPGFISRYRNYVTSGAVRSYYVDENGKEHTVQIAVDDWFISDFYSYITQTPATLFVEALEDSTIIRLEYDAIEALCGEMHSLSEYFRIATEKAFAFSRNRALSNISKSAEERYLEFLERYPNIIDRVPQYIIASYLGMSAEFLSKIRSRVSPSS